MALQIAKNSYQAKLFVPIACVMWLFILGTSLMQSYREETYRKEAVRERFDIINKRIIDLIEQGDDPSHFLKFVERYYNGSALNNISITINDKATGKTIRSIGEPLTAAEINNKSGSGKSFTTRRESIDNRYEIYMSLPFDSFFLDEVNGNNIWWWIFFISCGVGVTAILFITTRHLTNNVKLLRDFARNAANDAEFSTIDKFSNDDLGDISRQIVTIYNSRKAAIAARELEHQVVLKATNERNTMRRQMTNNINHELKTPATIIKGYLDTLVENPDMDPDSRTHFLNKARGQADRLCTILADLSTMTRLEEGSQKVQLEDIDFNQFVEDLVTDIEESGLADNMEVTVDLPPNCHVRANTNLLNSALMNLAKNAAAYSHGTRMGIKFQSQNRKYYSFIFYDNGNGVAEEHIPRLFDRFYRVDKGRSRKSGGTGLGLPIVKESIGTLGGTISVRNRAEGGLEFLFTLPIA